MSFVFVLLGLTVGGFLAVLMTLMPAEVGRLRAVENGSEE